MIGPVDIFAAVGEASRKSGLQVLVVGGHAVSAYGCVRTTLDADFLVCADDFAAWQQIFESLGYCWKGKAAAFVRFDPPSGNALALPVDLMLVSADTFLKLAANQRELEFGPTRLAVPDPLHLIALKLHAMKNDERRRLGKDLPDILQLIQFCSLDVEGLEFQQIVERYANPPIQALLRSVLAHRA